MRRIGLGLLVLLALPLAGAVGPERRLSGSGVSVSDAASAAFDGVGYVLVWSRTDALDRSVISYTRIGENSDVSIPATILMQTTKPNRPAVASNGGNTLLAWVDRPQDDAARFMGAYLNAEGVLSTPFVIFSDPATRMSAAIDVTGEELGFIVAVTGDNFVRILAFDAGATTPTRNVLISDDWGSDVRVGYRDGAMFVAWDFTFIERCDIPTGCIRMLPKARVFDYQTGVPLGGELVLTGGDLTSILSIDSGFIAATGGPASDQFVMTKISRTGVAGTTHIEPYRHSAAMASIGQRIFTGFLRGRPVTSASNAYFTLLDTDLRPQIQPFQAYTISSTLRNEDNLTVASGSRTSIAMYTATEADNVNRQEAESFLAYRIIDTNTLPPLPAAPPAPTLVAGSSVNAPTSVRIGWSPRAGTKFFRLELVSEDGMDRRDFIVGGNTTETTISIPRNGIYQFRLIVEDDAGISTASEALRVEVPTRETPPPPKPRRRSVRR